MSKSFSERRVFIQADEKIYKLFKFTQIARDGSIYISGFRNFPNIKWHGVDTSNSEIQIKSEDSTATEGKLSIHGSGMSTFRAHDQTDHRLIVHGNYLFDSRKNALGIRHLVTIYMEKPVEIPAAEYVTRNSDFFLGSSKALTPFNICLFAVPRLDNIRDIGIHDSFHIDDLEQIPPDGGFGLIELNYHQIAWYTYKTKYMDEWPERSHVSYSDGYLVPMFLRTADHPYTIIGPEYLIENKQLTIKFSKNDENDNLEAAS